MMEGTACQMCPFHRHYRDGKKVVTGLSPMIRLATVIIASKRATESFSIALQLCPPPFNIGLWKMLIHAISGTEKVR